MKLANHLRYGKLGHGEFYFGNYNGPANYNKEMYSTSNYDSKGCGTSGCAIGECPIVFRQWVFKKQNNGAYLPVLKIHKVDVFGILNPSISGVEFFGLNSVEYHNLFIPLGIGYSGGKMSGDTSKHKVSTNMRTFVKIKCKELKIPYTSLVNKRK